jgi:hypothetical protein
VTKRPAITTNQGPEVQIVEIAAQVTARPDSTYPIVIEPYKLDFSQYSEEVLREKEFALYNSSDKPLELSLVSQTDEFFEVVLPKTVEPNETVTGMVRLKESVMDQNFNKSLTIQVNDERNSRFTIPVKRSLRNVAAPTTPPKKAAGH